MQYIEDVVHGIDDAFDNAWTLYQDDMANDDNDEEEHEEDDDYETEESWDSEDSEEE